MAPSKGPPKAPTKPKGSEPSATGAPTAKAARPPLDDHTEPAFDDELDAMGAVGNDGLSRPHDPSLDHESATESIARELLTQLAKSRMSRMPSSSLSNAFREPSDGMTRTDAPKPGSFDDVTHQVVPVVLDVEPVEPAIDAHDQPTKLVGPPPIDALSLDMGDLTSDGLARLHAQHAQPNANANANDANEVNEFEVEVTAPGLQPVAKTGADALKEKRGDIAQLLASIAPFLWSLEAAEKWVRDKSQGDPEGEAHARSLALLARVLGQLQARIDEAQKNIR